MSPLRASTLFAAAIMMSGWAAAGPVSAHADDCAIVGEFGAAEGCLPPQIVTGPSDSWPPTDVGWPPGQDASAEGATPSGPIVLPAGETAPIAPWVTDSISPPEPPKPIVPVEAARAR